MRRGILGMALSPVVSMLGAAATLAAASEPAAPYPHRSAPTPKHSHKMGASAVRIGSRSSFKKLMRAARRGMIPPERQVIIDNAMKSAKARRRVYMTPAAIDRELQEAANV